MNRAPLTVGMVLLLPLLGGWDWLRSADENVAEGNRNFRQGSFSEALEEFERALDGGGDRASVHYDIGTALYKLAEKLEPGNDRTKLLDRAESEFRLGADTRQDELKSSSYHNLGNTHFARERFSDAIEAYKKALRANPKNDDARYNLELALRKLEQDQPPQQQPQQQKDQSGGPGQQGNQGKQDPGQSQPQPDPGQPGDPSGQGQPQSPRSPDGQSGPDPGGSQDQPGGQGADQQQPAPGDDPSEPEPLPDPAPGDPSGDQTSPQPPGDPQGNSQPSGGDRKPGDSQPGNPDRSGRPDRGGQGPAPDPRSESERKMDELERRSLEMRKQKLRTGSHSRGNWRVQPGKDW